MSAEVDPTFSGALGTIEHSSPYVLTGEPSISVAHLYMVAHHEGRNVYIAKLKKDSYQSLAARDDRQNLAKILPRSKALPCFQSN